MVPAAEQNQVAELGFAARAPVVYVMGVAESETTAREAAALVSMVERAAESGRNGACSPADIERSTLGVVGHHYQSGIAGEAPGRLRGNVRALESGNARGLRVGPGSGQHWGVDVDDDLVAIGPRAPVSSAVEPAG